MNNSVLGKTMEKVSKPCDIKLVETGKRRSYLLWEPNYHITKWFIVYIKIENIYINFEDDVKQMFDTLNCTI